MLNDNVQVEAILDEGSQIVGLRKDIWEKLGVPVCSDHKMNMISANALSNQTISLIHDLKVMIGAYNFYLQVQVVEHASYKMLLGQPFLTLTEANTQHHTNRDSHITLQDPNSKAIITFPTRAQGNAQEQQSAHVGCFEINVPYTKVFDPSNLPYHNHWFCVQKDDRKLELVHNKETGQDKQSVSEDF